MTRCSMPKILTFRPIFTATPLRIRLRSFFWRSQAGMTVHARLRSGSAFSRLFSVLFFGGECVKLYMGSTVLLWRSAVA